MQSSLLTRPGNALNPGGRAAAPNASALPTPQPHSPSPKPHLAPPAPSHARQALRGRRGHAAAAAGSGAAVLPEAEVQGMPQWLDSLKYSADGLVAVIVQVCAGSWRAV